MSLRTGPPPDKGNPPHPGLERSTKGPRPQARPGSGPAGPGSYQSTATVQMSGWSAVNTQ